MKMTDPSGEQALNLTLPEHIRFESNTDRARLAGQLAKHIATQLRYDIDAEGKATLVVSGGSTPVAMFEQLSMLELDWSRVIITLADERWVSPEHKDSNTALVQRHLLQNKAAAARFIPLWQPGSTAEEAVQACHERLSGLGKCISALILGMGNDGHTASLFPCSDDLNNAFACRQDCAAVTPATAPWPRITLTPKRLLNSRLRVLYVCGNDKLETLAHALDINDPKTMPVSLFLRQPLEIFWAP